MYLEKNSIKLFNLKAPVEAIRDWHDDAGREERETARKIKVRKTKWGNMLNFC